MMVMMTVMMMEAQSVQDDSGAGWQTQLRAKKIIVGLNDGVV